MISPSIRLFISKQQISSASVDSVAQFPQYLPKKTEHGYNINQYIKLMKFTNWQAVDKLRWIRGKLGKNIKDIKQVIYNMSDVKVGSEV